MLKKLFVLLMLPLFLCSCKKNDIEEITFSSWGSVTEVKILKDVIREFEQNNPKIKIRFIHIPQNYFQKLHLLFASSQAPDVIFINNLYLPVYADKLENLTDKVKSEDFIPQSLQALSYQGKILAIPRDISNLVFYYNKNLVGKEIDSTWTFNDFENLIKSVKNGYGVSYERDIYWAEPYIMTLGYDKGIELYKNLEGKYAPSPSEVGSSTLAQMFIEGKIGFYLSGRWMFPKISESVDFPYGIIPFPGITTADASGWAISKDSKHKESALKYLEFLASKETSQYFTRTGLIVPARIDTLDNIKETAFIDAIFKSKPRRPDKNYKKERDRINKELFN